MTPEQLQGYLEVGRGKQVCVHAVSDPVFPGFQRTVTIAAGNVVRVEFLVLGTDEGGACFVGRYENLPRLIGSLEAYTEKAIDDWRANDEVSDGLDSSQHDVGAKRLKDAIRTGTVPLPPGADFVQADNYWRQFR